MARRAIDNALNGQPDMTQAPEVQTRKRHLVHEARVTLDAIRSISCSGAADALTDAQNLTKAVNLGILDAPHLRNNPYAPGAVHTRIINGACEAITPDGQPLTETDRLKRLDL